MLLVAAQIGCSETAPPDPVTTSVPAVQASPTDTPPTLTPPEPTTAPPTPSPSPVPIAYITTPCPVTLGNGSTPPLESPSPGFHGNGELWTRLWDEGTVMFVPGGPGNVAWGRLKSMAMGFEWWRGVTGTLTIRGRRLDAPAPPLRSQVHGGYGSIGFQPAKVLFPTEGCWEVTGSVGDASLTFITLVELGSEGLASIAPAESVSGIPLLAWNANSGRYEARPVDPSTGRDLPDRVPIGAGGELGFAWYNAFSQDGRKFASFEAKGERVCWDFGGGSGLCGTNEAVLHLIDLQNWTGITAPLPSNGRAVLFTYSPDSTRVALTYLRRSDDGKQQKNTLMVFDAATGDVLSQTDLAFKPSLLEYGSEGSELIVYGAAEGPVIRVSKPGPPQLLLLDAATLQVNWERKFPDLVSGYWCVTNCELELQHRDYVNWEPAVILSDDQRKLYIVHAADDRITTVDLDDRTLQETEIRVARSWMERLLDLTAGVVEAKGWPEGVTRAAALSPDGARLYVLTHETRAFRSESGTLLRTLPGSLGLRVIHVKTGRVTSTRDTEADEIRFTPDGKHLLLDSRDGSSTMLEILDAESLDSVATLGQWRVRLARDLAGEPIMLATRALEETTTRFAVLDPETFEVVESWLGPNRAYWVAPWP